MKKLTKIQVTTVILIMIYVVWEIKVQIWAQSEPTVPIRVDLVLILPILFLMIILSILQYLRKK